MLGAEDLEEVLEVLVYDRWGTLLTSGGTSWDGGFAQPDAAEAGTYAYRVRVRMDVGMVRAFQGVVLLIKLVNQAP